VTQVLATVGYIVLGLFIGLSLCLYLSMDEDWYSVWEHQDKPEGWD
jgi:hypothetical protein